MGQVVEVMEVRCLAARDRQLDMVVGCLWVSEEVAAVAAVELAHLQRGI